MKAMEMDDFSTKGANKRIILQYFFKKGVFDLCKTV